MCRKLFPLFLVVLILGIATAAWGTQSSGRLVDLVIDGEPVQSRVPARLSGSRTMVPVRLISERLGADVEWLPGTAQVRVTLGDVSILLTIGDTTVRVGDSTTQLRAAPFIEDGTTLVPVRFVSETLGARVDWDGDTYTVYITSPTPPPEQGNLSRLVGVGFAEVEGGSGLEIRTVGNPRVEILPLESTGTSYPRMLVRLESTVLDMETTTFTLGGILLRGVVAQVDGDVPVTEILVDLLEDTTYTVLPARPDPDTGIQTITVRMEDRVRAVSFHAEPEGSRVDIATTMAADYTAFRLTDPDRLVVDIHGLSPGEGVAHLNLMVDEPPVTRIRAALFEAGPAITRVVVDSERPLAYDVEAHPGGIRVHLHGALESVDARLDGGLILSVGASIGVEPVVTWDGAGDTLHVDLPRIRYNGSAPINNEGPAATSLAVKETPVTLPSGRQVIGTRISIGLGYYGGHTVTASPGGLVLEILGSPLAGRTIVIDPGHGGRDPGAIGPRGTQEKAMALDVSLRLRDLLEVAGARVVLTREGDESIGLYERVAVANDLGADLIMSVHFNGDRNPDVRGTETFYCDNHPDSRRLAEITHRTLLEELGLTDRHIRHRREFVLLREPHMPSVLVEPAYISNPAEEELIRDPAFRDLVAHALYRSIMEFLGVD